MFHFDLESDKYSFGADVIATVIGGGAGVITGALAASVQRAIRPNLGSLGRLMTGAGVIGIDLTTMEIVASHMRDWIDEFARCYNHFADMADAYNAAKEAKEEAAKDAKQESVDHIVYEES